MKLAQLNIAHAKYPLEHPEMAGFMENLDRVNNTAENSEGFIWRLKDDSGNATSVKVFDDPNIIINMSVWQSVDSLKNFMFRSHHIDFMKQKSKWFHRLAEDTYVLWWVDIDHTPTIEEGVERLMHLREHGDTALAFTFKANFTAQDL